jgi:hypothetical protein
MPYQRERAVAYAHKWAYSRNPQYLSFNDIGGDCTNFISQCIHAGGAGMNYTPTYGWYYVNGNKKAPAWTGVPYLYNFLINNAGEGPYASKVDLSGIQIGDVIQLSFDGVVFGHSLFVVETGKLPAADNILIATHTNDSDYRPLSSFDYQKLRCIHILGIR